MKESDADWPVRRRLTILTQMDPWSASTRYRALQHVPRLRPFFESIDISLAGDTVVRRPGRVGQVLYFGTHAARYAHRTSALKTIIQDADVVLIQRGLYPLGPAWIMRALQQFGGRVVFDLDDAVFHVSPALANKSPIARWLYGPQQALAIMQRADEIVVSSEALAGMLPAGLPAPTVLPTVLDPSRYGIVRHHEHRPVVVGWAGTSGGLSYLNPFAHVFARLSEERLTCLEVVSSEPWAGPSRFRHWRLEDETSIFQDFSIGIMPLPDTDYTRAKASFKLLQYMASGIPVVSSPVGVNRQLIERSGGGLLADTPADWEKALRTLAADSVLRERLGRQGRAFVEGYVDLDAQAQTLGRLLVG